MDQQEKMLKSCLVHHNVTSPRRDHKIKEEIFGHKIYTEHSKRKRQLINEDHTNINICENNRIKFVQFAVRMVTRSSGDDRWPIVHKLILGANSILRSPHCIPYPSDDI